MRGERKVPEPIAFPPDRSGSGRNRAPSTSSTSIPLVGEWSGKFEATLTRQCRAHLRCCRTAKSSEGQWQLPINADIRWGAQLTIQNVPHPSGQFRVAERLCEELDSRVEAAMMNNRVPRIARREQCLDVRS